MPTVRVEFTCWKCRGALLSVPGEHFLLSAWLTCEVCGEAQAVTYKFPEATYETV